jgi:hypothetical protein
VENEDQTHIRKIIEDLFGKTLAEIIEDALAEDNQNNNQ